MVRQHLSPGPSPICESEHSSEVADEIARGRRRAFSQSSSSQPMTLTPAPAPTSWRSHPAVTISIDGTRSTSHGSPTRGTDFECWQAIAMPVADPRRRIAATRTAAAALSPSNLGARKRESPAPASSHTHAATVAAIAVDNYSTGLPTQCAVRASQQTGRAGDSSRAAVRSPNCDETACRVDPT